MRPDGIGRSGSLMASTCRSYQSFTAWLVPHTIGPASNTPATINVQRWPGATPDETMPQPSAHIGGNQVIGFSNSSTTEGVGCVTTALFIFGLTISRLIGEPKPTQLDVKALSAEAEHLRRGGAIAPGQFQRRFNRELFDDIGGLAYQIAQRHPADQFGQLRHRARQFARR